MPSAPKNAKRPAAGALKPGRSRKKKESKITAGQAFPGGPHKGPQPIRVTPGTTSKGPQPRPQSNPFTPYSSATYTAEVYRPTSSNPPFSLAGGGSGCPDSGQQRDPSGCYSGVPATARAFNQATTGQAVKIVEHALQMYRQTTTDIPQGPTPVCVPAAQQGSVAPIDNTTYTTLASTKAATFKSELLAVQPSYSSASSVEQPAAPSTESSIQRPMDTSNNLNPVNVGTAISHLSGAILQPISPLGVSSSSAVAQRPPHGTDSLPAAIGSAIAGDGFEFTTGQRVPAHSFGSFTQQLSDDVFADPPSERPNLPFVGKYQEQQPLPSGSYSTGNSWTPARPQDLGIPDQNFCYSSQGRTNVSTATAYYPLAPTILRASKTNLAPTQYPKIMIPGQAMKTRQSSSAFLFVIPDFLPHHYRAFRDWLIDYYTDHALCSAHQSRCSATCPFLGTVPPLKQFTPHYVHGSFTNSSVPQRNQPFC